MIESAFAGIADSLHLLAACVVVGLAFAHVVYFWRRYRHPELAAKDRFSYPLTVSTGTLAGLVLFAGAMMILANQ